MGSRMGYDFAMPISSNSPDAHDERWARELICSRTGVTAPLDELTNLSPAGDPWLVTYDLDESRGPVFRQRLQERPWSLWRYRELLPIADYEARVDLGEGATPLVPLRRPSEVLADTGCQVYVKEEGSNPTGSFKDRGLTMAINRARELGVRGVQLATAGNAGLATAAYATASGICCRVAMPDDAPTVIRNRTAAYGAQVLTSPGTLVDAAARLQEFDDGFFTVSTFREPYRVEGKKTMGLEIAEQLGWTAPDWIVYPTGGGTGIVAMHKAFDELRRLGIVKDPSPRFVVVQMEGCAPIVNAFNEGLDEAPPWQNAHTSAWGLRVPRSLADFVMLKILRETNGDAVAIPEEELDGTRARLARDEGLLFGAEGAAALLAVEELARRGRIERGHRVVVFQTGHPANYGLA